MDSPREEPRSIEVDEPASDVLRHATVSDTNDMYRAQVAVEGKTYNTKEGKKEVKTAEKQRHVDISEFAAVIITDFNVNLYQDKQIGYVTGIISLADKVIIVDNNNRKLKLFAKSGFFLSSTDLVECAWAIAHVENELFVTCGDSKKVFMWELRDNIIVSKDASYKVDNRMDCIDYNNTYYCVLHQEKSALTIMDKKGGHVRKIMMKKNEPGDSLYMDNETHNIYVPCWDKDGILCMSVEGKKLWFTPIPDAALFGITEIYGELCVADFGSCCLRLVSKTGQYIGELLGRDELIGRPDYIYYDSKDKRLYVSHIFGRHARNVLTVYSVVLETDVSTLKPVITYTSV